MSVFYNNAFHILLSINQYLHATKLNKLLCYPDFIEERKELGFHSEGHRRRGRKDKYNYYVLNPKEYFKKLDT